MPLKLIKRGDIYYVRGTVRGRRICETAGTSERQLADAFRAKRETELFEAAIFGERAVVSFRRAALSYLDFEPRSQRTKDYVASLVDHFGDTRLGQIDQDAADRAVEKIVGLDAAPATKVRVVYTPLTAILTHAAHRGWCARPDFEMPKPPKGKTRWLTPAEAEALVSGSAPHLKPLLTFYLCTGARVSEALDLDWTDVDLAEARAVFRCTKNERDRVAALPPAAVAALAALPHRDGRVFRRDDGEPYTDRERLDGGQIKTAFHTACRNAQLMRTAVNDAGEPKLDDDGNVIRVPSLTPHDLRHTWATWFYAISKDLLLLKSEGGWRTLSMVERYAHLMPSELVPQISNVWGGDHPRLAGAKSVQADAAPSKVA